MAGFSVNSHEVSWERRRLETGQQAKVNPVKHSLFRNLRTSKFGLMRAGKANYASEGGI